MSSNLQVKGPSAAWYLLPIFLGIIGGLVMYIVVKDRDAKMAKKGLIVGIILTVAGIAISVAISAASFMAMQRYSP